VAKGHLKLNKQIIDKSMSYHKGGKKIGKRHTTLIDASRGIVDLMQRNACVTKIILGPIKSVGSGPHRCKVTKVSNGLMVMVRGTTSIQTLFVYTKDSQYIKQIIEEEFGD